MSESPPRVAWWRYVVPNLITSSSLIFGVLGIQAAASGRPVEAAWWCMWVVLSDKADGFVANALKGTSAFGVQLDSLADLVGFGVVPSITMYAYYSAHPEHGWTEGGTKLALRVICAVYVVCTALRLARFNVMAARGGEKHYTGFPSTMTAGTLMMFFLTCLKYSSPALSGSETVDTWRVLPLHLDALVPWLPLTLLLGAAGMLSPVRVPRLGRTFSRVTDVLLIAFVASGYVFGLMRRMPEHLTLCGLWYVGITVAYHIRTVKR
jgi:CDP-diacylglycerol--serine O-phosphatidyltransferase